MRLSRSRRVLLALGTLTLVMTACGGDDGDETESADQTTTEATETTETTEAADDDTPSTTAGAAASDEVEVVAVDYGYEGIPDTAPAGTKLTLTNESEVELHELVAFRLPDEEARPAEELMQLPEEELGALFGGPPGMVLVAPPAGAPQIAAVGDGTLGEPGRYLVFCGIPTGADPQEYLAAAQASGGAPPEVEGGPPHFVRGMFAELTVE